MKQESQRMFPCKSASRSHWATLRAAILVLVSATVPLPAGAFGPPPNAELSIEKLSRIDDFLNDQIAKGRAKAGDRDVRIALYTAAHALLTRSYAWSTLKAWGTAAGEGPWPPTRRHRGGPQTGRDPAPHVGGRHRLPGLTSAGGCMS